MMNTKWLLSLSLVALNISNGHAAGVCNDKKIIETKTLTAATGEVITMQTFSCSNAIENEGVSRREPPHIERSIDPLLKRSAAQCTQANCMCGLPCTFSRCVNPGTPIKSSDCNILGTGLLNMNSPATFFIPPGQGAAFFVETCEVSVSNPVNAVMQYCFSDLGINALATTNNCPNLEGICSGTFAGNTWFIGQVCYLLNVTELPD